MNLALRIREALRILKTGELIPKGTLFYNCAYPTIVNVDGNVTELGKSDAIEVSVRCDPVPLKLFIHVEDR